MKILLATDTYPPHVNGTAYFIYRFAHALAKKGHQVYVVAPSTSFKNKVEKHNDGVVVFRIKSLPILFYPDFRFTLPAVNKAYIQKCVQKASPDIVHLQQHFMIGKDVFDCAVKGNIAMVGTNHFLPENLIHYFPIPKKAKNALVKNAWKQFAKIYNQLEIVTTPTPTAAKIIANVGLKTHVVAVSNGINLKRFNPQNAKINKNAKYEIPDEKSLLFVGRLDKEKQLDILLRSVALALKKVDFHFTIVGIGAQESKLKNLAKELGIEKNITFTGFVKDEDLPYIYASAKVFVIAGLAELQSIATMEAMASGLPIIAANAKALPELVHDIENGYLVKPSDYKAYAQKMVTLFTNERLRQKMGKKSLEIIKKHSEETSVAKFLALYSQIIKKKSKRV